MLCIIYRAVINHYAYYAEIHGLPRCVNAEHPPTFLVQHRNVDENADACATLNYHQTMVAHGGRSEIHMIEPDEARCFCIERGSSSAATLRPGPRPPPGIPPRPAAPA
jgi:hypothetical protein